MNILSICREVKKCLSNLLFLDPQLILIADREPLRPSIELKSFWEVDFYRRLHYDIELLSFIVGLSSLEDSYIDATSGDASPRYDDFSSIRRDSESLPSEDELVDQDICEDFHFLHK